MCPEWKSFILSEPMKQQGVAERWFLPPAQHAIKSIANVLEELSMVSILIKKAKIIFAW